MSKDAEAAIENYKDELRRMDFKLLGAIGFAILFAGIAIAGWVGNWHKTQRLAESERIRNYQGARLAAFMVESDSGITPAAIIESLQAKVRGIERANAGLRGATSGLREDMAACGCEETMYDFAGPNPKPWSAGEAVSTVLAPDGGPAIRLERE